VSSPRVSARSTARRTACGAHSSERRLMPEPCRSSDRTYPRLFGRSDLVALTEPTWPEPRPLRDAELRRAIEALDSDTNTHAAGALLEHIADRLSGTRGMSIVRGRGDGSLGDRWPRVANALRKTEADDMPNRSPGRRSSARSSHPRAMARAGRSRQRRRRGLARPCSRCSATHAAPAAGSGGAARHGALHGGRAGAAPSSSPADRTPDSHTPQEGGA
jgi:hypothetical protein